MREISGNGGTREKQAKKPPQSRTQRRERKHGNEVRIYSPLSHTHSLPLSLRLSLPRLSLLIVATVPQAHVSPRALRPTSLLYGMGRGRMDERRRKKESLAKPSSSMLGPAWSLSCSVLTVSSRLVSLCSVCLFCAGCLVSSLFLHHLVVSLSSVPSYPNQ